MIDLDNKMVLAYAVSGSELTMRDPIRLQLQNNIDSTTSTFNRRSCNPIHALILFNITSGFANYFEQYTPVMHIHSLRTVR